MISQGKPIHILPTMPDPVPIGNRFPVALILALAIHLLVFWLWGDPARFPSKFKKQDFIPIELVRREWKDLPIPPPEKPDVLAEVNHVAQNQERRSAPSHKPKPVLLPAVGRPMARNKETSAKKPQGTREREGWFQKKAGPEKRDEMEKKSTSLAAPGLASPLDFHAQPLSLSPSLSEIRRWDTEQNQTTAEIRGKEETVDLSTRKIRYAVYFSRLKERIEQGWVYPARAKGNKLSGNLRLRFTLDREGRLISLKILRSSGEEVLDESALRAVKNAAPFAPFPKSWSLEKIHVNTTFEYIRRRSD